MIRIVVLAISLLTAFQSFSQVGYGFVVSHDLYQHYKNADDGIAYGGAGSALLNLGLGPKIWLGGSNVSLSVEAQAQMGFLGLAVKDYKGMGMLGVPVLAKLNFNGTSMMDREGRFGTSIGGGLQWSRTELYNLRGSFEDQGVTREFFRTFIVEASYGFGISGIGAQLYLRHGWDPDSDAKTWNFGLKYDINIPKSRQITDPASEL